MLDRLLSSPFFKQHNFLATEDMTMGVHEFVMDQRRVYDDKLVHVGVCILQQSKLMFLQFIDYLRTYLMPGSYSTVYCGIYKNIKI